jgi:hypothetical protein
MKLLLFILFLPLSLYSQLNIEAFGAKETNTDNSIFIQKAIDSALKTGKTVYIPVGTFRISRPLIIAVWNGKDYGQSTIKIIGESTFWDSGNRSVLVSQFGDAPLLSIQKGKGCIIDGVTFVGQWKAPGSPYKKSFKDFVDPNTRESRYSPYCAIAIDPFAFGLPIDGGYPPLKSFYRGSKTKGGSTGIIIKNCVFNGFTVGAITSPNGYTQNAELITFENIQIINCKVGFAGCQAQEKMNRIINVGAWGTTHTLFCFNTFGEGTPGNWIIDGVNVAGEVNQIIFRGSGSYFPLFISNLYAESIFQFGYWQSFVGDAITNFVIDFADNIDEFPKAHFEGGGVTLNKGVVRYYGSDAPIIFMGGKKHEQGYYTLRDVRTTESLGISSTYIQGYLYSLPDGVSEKDCMSSELKSGQISSGRIGKTVIFLDNSNTLLGYATLNGNKIKKKSLGIKDGYYKIVIK